MILDKSTIKEEIRKITKIKENLKGKDVFI